MFVLSNGVTRLSQVSKDMLGGHLPQLFNISTDVTNSGFTNQTSQVQDLTRVSKKRSSKDMRLG